MSQLTIPVLLGTAREGRESEKVAQYVLSQAQAYGFQSTLVDIRDHLTPMTVRHKDDETQGVAWKEIVEKANALIIVSPEYNHGYPGELKILLDKLAPKTYKDLPIGIIGVSSGAIGGARMIEHIQSVLNTLKTHWAGSVSFPTVESLFAGNDELPDERILKKLTKLFDELKRLTGLFRGNKG